MYTRGTKNWPPCANGRLGGTVVTITLLFTFITILLTVRLPTHLEQTKSVCVIIYLYVKKCIMLEMVREANKIINNFRGEHEVIFIRSILAERFPCIVVAQWYNVWLTNERRRVRIPCLLSVYFLQLELSWGLP
jgi:hypothetical protein